MVTTKTRSDATSSKLSFGRTQVKCTQRQRHADTHRHTRSVYAETDSVTATDSEIQIQIRVASRAKIHLYKQYYLTVYDALYAN